VKKKKGKKNEKILYTVRSDIIKSWAR